MEDLKTVVLLRFLLFSELQTTSQRIDGTRLEESGYLLGFDQKDQDIVNEGCTQAMRLTG